MGKIDGYTRASGVEQAGAGGRNADARAGGKADAPEPRMGTSERLTIELARLRAKFGADPAIAGRSFDEAWMSPTAAMEEDEAEFIDAVADCLGVGLSLDAALTCWDAGGLVYQDADEDEEVDGEGGDEGGGRVETSLPAVAAYHPHASGRRLLIP